MKKIDILNFITNFRKSPNDIKTYKELLSHLGESNEAKVNDFLCQEYLALQKAVETFDERMISIKTWSVTASDSGRRRFP